MVVSNPPAFRVTLGPPAEVPVSPIPNILDEIEKTKKSREEAEKFFFNNELQPNGMNASYFYKDDVGVNCAWRDPCYANLTSPGRNLFRVPKNPHVLLVGYPVHPGPREKISEAYFNWVTDPKISPWRNLVNLEEIEVFKNYKGHKTAYSVPVSFLKKMQLGERNHDHLLHFLSVFRPNHEWTSRGDMWYHMVNEHGADPIDAFLIMTAFTIDTRGQISRASMTVGHWNFPSSSWPPRKVLEDGDFNVKTNRTSVSVFPSSGRGATAVFAGLSPKEMKTTFSTISTFDAKEILERCKVYGRK